MWSLSDTEEISDCIAGVYRSCSGRELDDDQIPAYLDALRKHDVVQVMDAIRCCHEQVKGHLAPRDIIDRIATEPGAEWWGADEAWAKCPTSEAETAAMNDEMAKAHSDATGNTSDPVAQRMAFRSIYERLVREARSAGKTPRWWMSHGTDKGQRERALRDAQLQGLLSSEAAKAMLPDGSSEDTNLKQLMDGIDERAVRSHEQMIRDIVSPLTDAPWFGHDLSSGTPPTEKQCEELAQRLQADKRKFEETWDIPGKMWDKREAIMRRQRLRDEEDRYG